MFGTNRLYNSSNVITATGNIAANGYVKTGSTSGFYGSAAVTPFWSDNSSGYVALGNLNSRTTIAWYDSTKGFNCDSINIRGKLAGSKITADTFRVSKGLSLRSTATSIMIDSAVIKADSLIFYVGGVGYGAKQKD